MILLAIGFFAFMTLSFVGLIIYVVEIVKGRKKSNNDDLPEPIRKALGDWF